jgi:alpha-galactosidase
MMTSTQAAAPVALTPPMGWNSYDALGTSITEEETLATARAMKGKLLPHGWNYLVIDARWYDSVSSFDDRNFNKERVGAKLFADTDGRMLPAPNRFPSAADGQGFKPLADKIHAMGLKFGFHMMRGIPRQAVQQNTPIKGTSARAADIASTNSICQWNPDMYGVDVRKPGGQEYYNSIFEMLASWGVDFIKVDDLSRPYDATQKGEVEAIRKAIDKTGRPIVFSTSPGETPLREGAHINQHANMWRISDDFWDGWPQLLSQFKRLHDWTPFRIPGAWPDADMLPLGVVKFTKPTRFTHDEQITLMTLWSIARSPLIHGGDMTKTDDFTLSLLTNDEVLAVNQHSENNRQLFRTDDGLVAWVADVPNSKDKYLAVFNTRNVAKDIPAGGKVPVPVKLTDVGFTGSVKIRDLWAHKNLAFVTGDFAPEAPFHGAALFRLS